ncbi:hypothetical protein SDC9_79454 [bioreactor metagenome]|uniref:Uncharacterized protein n=1 Tax=bioreactor metagenome TaxID=1076179 RepID=A0A644YXZ4_9ZZZZ
MAALRHRDGKAVGIRLGGIVAAGTANRSRESSVHRNGHIGLVSLGTAARYRKTVEDGILRSYIQRHSEGSVAVGRRASDTTAQSIQNSPRRCAPGGTHVGNAQVSAGKLIAGISVQKLCHIWVCAAVKHRIKGPVSSIRGAFAYRHGDGDIRTDACTVGILPVVKIAAGGGVRRKRNLTTPADVGGVGRCHSCTRLVKIGARGHVEGTAAGAAGRYRHLVCETGEFHPADDHVVIDTLVGT